MCGNENCDHETIKSMLVTRDGQIVHPALQPKG
jgi:hypothetical protein